jgi:hypothetical protein
MNKIAQFINYHRVLGSNYARNQMMSKTAGIIPSSRLGKLTTGALGVGGALAAAKAMQPEPSMLENMYDGGRDMLSNMSQEDLMGYANLLNQMSSQGGYSMGYDAGSMSPVDYSMSDIGDPYASMGYAAQDPYASMGYEAQMSPEEMAQYMAYYQ